MCGLRRPAGCGSFRARRRPGPTRAQAPVFRFRAVPSGLRQPGCC